MLVLSLLLSLPLLSSSSGGKISVAACRVEWQQLLPLLLMMMMMMMLVLLVLLSLLMLPLCSCWGYYENTASAAAVAAVVCYSGSSGAFLLSMYLSSKHNIMQYSNTIYMGTSTRVIVIRQS